MLTLGVDDRGIADEWDDGKWDRMEEQEQKDTEEEKNERQ